MKSLIIALPVLFLIACNSEAEDTSNTNENDVSTDSELAVETNYGSTFGECSGTNQMNQTEAVELDEYSFAMANVIGLDLSSCTVSTAELKKNHQTLRVKFVSDPAITSTRISGYAEGQFSMTINAKSKTEELVAGTYTGDDLDITLVKGLNDNGTTSTKSIGSNKIVKTLIINEISETQVCGSFTMTGEDGTALFSADFSSEVEIVEF